MANEKNYNSMAIKIGVAVLIVYFLIKVLVAIFDFYAISAAVFLNYLIFFVALGIFSLILPKVRGEIFYK